MKLKITFAEWVEKNDDRVGKFGYFSLLDLVLILIHQMHSGLVIPNNGIGRNVDTDGHLKMIMLIRMSFRERMVVYAYL